MIKVRNDSKEVRDTRGVKIENHRKGVRWGERAERVREKEVRVKQMETEIDILTFQTSLMSH